MKIKIKIQVILEQEKCTYSCSQWFNYAEIGLQISGMCCIAGAPPGPTHIYICHAIIFVFAPLELHLHSLSYALSKLVICRTTPHAKIIEYFKTQKRRSINSIQKKKNCKNEILKNKNPCIHGNYVSQTSQEHVPHFVMLQSWIMTSHLVLFFSLIVYQTFFLPL